MAANWIIVELLIGKIFYYSGQKCATWQIDVPPPPFTLLLSGTHSHRLAVGFGLILSSHSDVSLSCEKLSGRFLVETTTLKTFGT